MADRETLLNLAADETAVAAFLADCGGRLIRDETESRPTSGTATGRQAAAVRWVARFSVAAASVAAS